MELGGKTWVVTADSAHARVFEERRRSAELRELPDRAMRFQDEDRLRAHRHLATSHDRAGYGRHGAGERDPDAEAARRFLRRVARELDAAAQRGAFDSLVVIAPPRALGILKAELPPGLHARLAATEPHDAIREDAEQVRERLRGARARSWRR
jgi:protein required for attachment to host cells